MALETRLDLKLTQKLVLTPQLQMAIKLLQMPQLELSQTISQELAENPFLEETPEFSTAEELPPEEMSIDSAPPDEIDDTEIPLERLSTYSNDDYFEERAADGRDVGYFTPGTVTQPTYEYFLSTEAERFDHLIWQLRFSRDDESVRTVAEVVIGNLDENGYLRLSDEEIAELTSASVEVAAQAVALVQSFDPPGIAARDIRECLLIQLRARDSDSPLLVNLVENHLELIGKKKYQDLAKTLAVQLDDILTAVKVIEDLDPKPGRNLTASTASYIIPDVFIVKNDDAFQIILNDEGIPRLRITGYYQHLLNKRSSVSPEERQFLEDKLRSAIWLIKSLDQRNKTIYRVTESILNFQRDFFDSGVHSLKPLNLKDVALELNLHESTISRVTSNKYLSCPHGTYSFKFFFSNAIPSDNGDLSSTTVKEMIKKIIAEENPTTPLSDMKIVDIFKSQNITIARRTIAKYRDELKIPPQSQRRTHEQ